MPSLKSRPRYSWFTHWRGILIAIGLIALVLIVCFSQGVFAVDAPSVEWSQTFNNLHGVSVIQTSDGGYIVAAASYLPDTATLIKVDKTGTVQWQKSQGNIMSVAQTSDLGFVLFEDKTIIKTNAQGETETIIQLAFNGVKKGVLASDGGYMIAGNSAANNGEYFAWLQKLDTSGNIVWNNTYTGGFTLYDIAETDDRGCALAGNWKTDFWLIRLDSNGNQLWNQFYAYGGPLDQHIAYSVAKTKDGGFILAGTGEWQESGGFIPWLVKINSLGYPTWCNLSKQFPNESFSTVMQTADEGYVATLGRQAALLKTNSSGNELWTLPLNRGEGYYTNTCLAKSQDGGYIVAGTIFEAGFVAKVSAEPDAKQPVVIIANPQSKAYETGDIPLVVTVNKPVSKIAYTLDGQPEATITGNTTLSGLAVGPHNITVSAQDQTGLIGSSSTIQFTVASRFPTELAIASIAASVVASTALLVYFKRNSLATYRRNGLSSIFKKQHLVAFANNRITWTLTIIGLTVLLVFTQIFFPYVYNSSLPANHDSPFEVGVTYVYERDNPGQIYSEVARIKELGFEVIRANLVCDSNNPSAYSNTLTNVFFSAIKELNIKVALIINNHDSTDNINYYLEKWGQNLAYIQILNEPDVASSWDMGALFTDDEAGSKFEQVFNTVEQHQLTAQYYTNFGPAFLVRTNLPIEFSEKLDFIGFDVFMDSFLTLSPRMIQLLQKISNKEIVIAEFGKSTSDDKEQSDYILKGLTLFKNMGLRGCWIVYWNSADNIYGIRGRLAEQKIGEWIAQNS